MRERCDADRILRWVFRQAYGLRNPSTDQLRNYQHWHAVSRRDGFDGLEPPDWRDWPWRPVPPGVTPLAITQPEPASPETISAQCAQMPETIDEVSTGAQCAPVPPPRQRERQSAQAEKVREQMRADEAKEAAERLLRRRLADGASRPYSALESEARAAGIPVDVLAVTANRFGVVTMEGRWQLLVKNGHAPAVSPGETVERPAALSPKERAALIKARRLLREQLANGSKPESEIEVRFAEQGLRAWLIEAADALGVRTQRGQWWLPQT